MTVLRKLMDLGRLVKLSHTVFGMPFALAAALMAHRFATQTGEGGLDVRRIVLIVVAFTGARTAAMGFNRIVDRGIDGQNPRTADRELVRGVVSVRSAWALTLASAAIFCAASAGLGWWPAVLAPACLPLVLGYSYFKRFSWSSHLALGAALSLAPAGAWLAVTDSFEGFAVPALLMAAVATWVAGFDVLYSLADEDFDRTHGLHSIPARFGRLGALVISGALHVATIAALTALHFTAHLGAWHLVGVLGVAAVLVYEHAIVRPSDLSRLGKAFFDLNGYVSLAYLAAVALDILA